MKIIYCGKVKKQYKSMDLCRASELDALVVTIKIAYGVKLNKIQEMSIHLGRSL